MNKWQCIGIAAGFFAFLAVAILISQFITQGILETCGPGAIAAYFTWKYFDKKDAAELTALMNPSEEVWPVPLPVAWATIKDVFGSTGVDTRESGRQNWKLLNEDKSRGIIKAQLDFQEAVAGQQGQKEVVPRSIGVTAVLAPSDPTGENAGTKVKFNYSVLSKVSIYTVKNIIRETNKQFPKTMLANKEQQGL